MPEPRERASKRCRQRSGPVISCFFSESASDARWDGFSLGIQSGMGGGGVDCFGQAGIQVVLDAIGRRVKVVGGIAELAEVGLVDAVPSQQLAGSFASC